MKHVLTSVGLVVLGAGSLYAYDPEMTRQQSGRPFSVAATVRGFYDDNVNTSPNNNVESLGFQVSPSVHLNLPMEQTFLAVGYTYAFTWYENRNDHKTDQSHEFDAKLRHEFSPRHQIGVDDTFIVTSEPTVNADRTAIITTPVRTKSSVYQNRGAIDDTFQITQLWGASFGYVNNWYDYRSKGVGSRSALLDRIEHLIRADARYQFNPKLVGIVGYTFGLTTYTGDEQLQNDDPATLVDESRLKSNDRDSYSHYAYVGVDYDITAKLRASVRGGIQYSDYHRLNESSVSPYADASVTYAFLPGSSIELGVRHTRSATDVVATDSKGHPTLDAEATAVYAQLQHHITHALTVTVMGQYQNSVFNDGANDGDSEDLFLAGVNFDYRFNRHLSAELGYNYDAVKSHLSTGDRSYTRNRIYVGLRATY